MTQIREIMSSNPEWLAPTTSIAEAARIMNDRDIGIIPIGKDDKLIGMVTDRDIVTRAVAKDLDLAQASVGEIMTNEVLYCRESDDVDQIALNLGEQRVRRLPVVDDDKRFVGMVTVADIAARASASSAGVALSGIKGG